MQRIPHDEKGTWIKQFKYINSTPEAKRFYLDNASYLVYSIVIEPDHSTTSTLVEFPVEEESDFLEIKFGQFISPHRNLNLFKKFHFDIDISVNRRAGYSSFPEEDDIRDRNFLMVERETLLQMCSRFNIQAPSTNFTINFPKDFYKLFLGYNHIRSYVNNNVEPIDRYEAISSEVMATVGEDCFTWVEIIDGELDTTFLGDDFHKSSGLLLDYKLVIDKKKLENWFKTTFTYNRLSDWTIASEIPSFEFNFILYPPVASGMQLEDTPRILSPNGILRNRVIDEVVFSVSRSYVSNSQKVFEIYFSEVETGDLLYKANSLENYSDFILKGSGVTIEPEYLLIENSVFENLSGINYPEGSFKVTYTLPNDLKKFLSSHLNYTITVRVTDLTSERRP